MRISKFTKFAIGTLIFNQVVGLWGAYVRATGYGAGCGSHWPLCNGVVIPRDPQVETMIEFAHRIMSGLFLVIIVILVIWASGHTELIRVNTLSGLARNPRWFLSSPKLSLAPAWYYSIGWQRMLHQAG